MRQWILIIAMAILYLPITPIYSLESESTKTTLNHLKSDFDNLLEKIFKLPNNIEIKN